MNLGGFLFPFSEIVSKAFSVEGERVRIANTEYFSLNQHQFSLFFFSCSSSSPLFPDQKNLVTAIHDVVDETM